LKNKAPNILIGYLSIAIVVLMATCLLSTGRALAAGDANQATCSEFPGTEASPGFRSFLPDCRAYELVTPPYKGGQPAGLRGVSVDGNHLLGYDFAGFAGTEDLEQNRNQFGAIYEFSRTSAGWNAESLEPPAWLAARGDFVGASADLSRSLWELIIQSKEGEEFNGGGESPEEAFTLAVREVGPDGRARFTPVGPMDSPGQHIYESERFRFAGASRDLLHILLGVTVGGQRWPGDSTLDGDRSLYEYVGTDNSEPRLVGVRNAGALEGAAHVNEHAELVSECGTILGSAGTGSTYNAVSADGAVVYFTAQHIEGCTGNQPPVDELYARIDGAQTVSISEPTAGVGGDCTQCDDSEPKAAVFQGASEDGSKVFFLSNQKLLPGAKGENLYEYDFHAESGKRVVLVAAEVPDVARISEDGSHVYFVSKLTLTTAPNANTDKAEEGAYNLYVYATQTGAPSFIANLLTVEEEQTIRNRVENSEQLANEIDRRIHIAAEDEHRPFETTPNGRYLAFVNPRDLTGDDTGTAAQIFEYDSETDRVARVSVGQRGDYLCPSSGRVEEGYNCDGNTNNTAEAATILSPARSEESTPTAAASELSLSQTGAVFFGSSDALTPAAVGERENIYEYHEGNVYLISPGDEAAPLQPPETRLLDTNESGGDVFFSTTDSLLPQHTDTQASWYDARSGGGFPAPLVPPACVGDACQGPLSTTPPTSSAGSTGIAEGNLAPPASKPVVKPLTSSEKLAKARNACRKKKNRKKRAVCEKQAKRAYGAAKKASRDRRASR